MERLIDQGGTLDISFAALADAEPFLWSSQEG